MMIQKKLINFHNLSEPPARSSGEIHDDEILLASKLAALSFEKYYALAWERNKNYCDRLEETIVKISQLSDKDHLDILELLNVTDKESVGYDKRQNIAYIMNQISSERQAKLLGWFGGGDTNTDSGKTNNAVQLGFYHGKLSFRLDVGSNLGVCVAGVAIKTKIPNEVSQEELLQLFSAWNNRARARLDNRPLGMR